MHLSKHVLQAMSSRTEDNSNPAGVQLKNYKENHPTPSEATSSSGNPVPCLDATLTVGPKGPLLMADTQFLDEITHFNREKIPERVIFGKGAGAFGTFEVTHDITQYSAAQVFKKVNKKTPIAVRISKIRGEIGSPDTVRSEFGLAVKFYTEDGIWDLLTWSIPINPFHDPILSATTCHANRRNPKTHLIDSDMWWDFLTLNPQAAHAVVMLYADRGIPDGYRHMNGYGVNTFSLINESGVVHYCKFHLHTQQGIANLLPDEAQKIVAKDPDYSVRDLYNNIANGNHPSWTLSIQVMTPEQAKTHRFDPFDPTKIWSHKTHPLIPVGRLVLNRNPSNYFAEVEQIAFNPGNLVVGIGISPDINLQGRLFAYRDAQLYRLGVNGNQLPVNMPFKVCNYLRDGRGVINNQNGSPNYHPNSFNGPRLSRRAVALAPSFEVNGRTGCYDLGNEDNFTQAGEFYRDVLKEDERTRLAKNIAADLRRASKVLQVRGVAYFSQVDNDLGRDLGAILVSSIEMYADL